MKDAYLLEERGPRQKRSTCQLDQAAEGKGKLRLREVSVLDPLQTAGMMLVLVSIDPVRFILSIKRQGI